jgi:hypothetical protein
MALRRPALKYFFNEREHGELIEMPASKVCFLPDANLQLPIGDGSGGVDARPFEPIEMVVSEIGIDDVESLVPPVEPFLYKGQENAVLLIRVGEQGTHMPGALEHSVGKPDLTARLGQRITPCSM